MNVQTLKAFTWLGALAAGGTLSWNVADFLRHRPELQQFVTQEEQYEVLRGFETPAEPKRDLVDYESVRRGFRELEWTGKETPKVEAGPVDEGPNAQKPVIPVSTLLRVLVIHVDGSDPAGSLAVVKYVDGKLARYNDNSEDTILRVDERLFPPYENIRVESIGPEGVSFGFDDEEREFELVTTQPFPTDGDTIVVVDQALLPDRDSSIWTNPNPAPYNPRDSVQIGRNEWVIGTETLSQIDDDYAVILSRDLQYRQARDPGTGQVKGIQITKVAPGSLPAQHGVTSGEVLISINGHQVKSVNDAVAYVKKESETTNTWVALFEKQGRQFTRVYKSPE